MEQRFQMGHTAITWDNDAIEEAVTAIASCGYKGTETFGWVLEEWEAQGRDLLEVFQRNGMALTSLYCHLDLQNPQVRGEEIDQVMAWIRMYRKFNGPVVVIGGKMFDRRAFRLPEHVPHVVDTLNELARRITDEGLLCCFHPHTGTAVETEEEIHRVMNAVDTRYVSFAPDLGQIAKGGGDPLAVVREYHEITRMVHLKDYVGGPVEYNADGVEIDKTGFLCYTPLGQGTVEIPSILRYLSEIGYSHHAYVELDGNQWSSTRKGNPMLPPLEAIRASKEYLLKLGYVV